MANKWLKLFPDAARNKAEFLIDGEDTFKSMIQAIETAQEQGHYIYILGWMLDADFQLVKGDKDKTLFKLLESASQKRNVEIRVLIWDNLLPDYSKLNEDIIPRLNQLPSTKAFVDGHTFTPEKSKQIIQKLEPQISYLINKYQKYLLNPASRLEEFYNVSGSDIIYRLLSLISFKTIGAHHDKIVIVKGKDGLIAFCGGIEFNKNRVMSTPHPLGYRFPALHDTTCRLQGPAAYEILQRFKRRWRNNPFAKKASLLGENEVKPKEAGSADPFAKVVGTYTNPDSSEKDRSLRDAYFAIIDNAERYIYIEDQYLVNLDVASRLNNKIKESGFKKLTFAIQDSIATADILIPNRKRSEFMQAVLNGATEEQKNKVLLAVIDKTYWKRDHYHPGLHAKTLIVDDEIAIIGSANVNQRSFTFDSETSVIIFDTGAKRSQNFAYKFRAALWKHYFRKPIYHFVHESWWLYPTLLSTSNDYYSNLVKYTYDSQPDLDERIISLIKKHSVLVAAATLTVSEEIIQEEGENIKQYTVSMLNPQNIRPLFDDLWEYFVDPKAD